MKILIHDFASYSFPVQLARQMARDGHSVFYTCSDFYEVKGNTRPLPDDPSTFTLHTVSIGEPHAKYQFSRRAAQEWRYAGELAEFTANAGVDVVASCNTPLITADRLSRACRKQGIRYLHWAQDLHSLAIQSVLKRRNPLVGRVAGRVFQEIEKGIIQRADACIVISEDFLQELESLRITPKRTAVIPNWMPLDEMVPTARDNPWARRHELHATTNIMYVGTLSLKHDAEPFLALAEHFRNQTGIRVVVVSAGVAFDALKLEKERRGLGNLILLGWQKYEELSMVFGAGDVLFATVSADGSRFSVPCKVLSYASAGRTVLAHMPRANLVSRIVEENRFGLSVDLADIPGLCAAADRLVNQPAFRAECERRARAYAEATFQIRQKADAFYDLIRKCG